MRFLMLVLAVCVAVSGQPDEFDDQEFEFDIPEADDSGEKEEAVEEDEEEAEGGATDDGGMVVEEDEEFDALDKEEFEGAQKQPSSSPASSAEQVKIAESTVRLKPFWEAYVLELVVVAGLVVYAVTYFVGRTRNASIAQNWLNDHTELLQKNFSYVGDNGEGDFPNEGHVVKDSDNCFTVWCTGRTGCDWMMAQLRLQRRQDLFTLLLSLVRPSPDTVMLTFQLAADDMDNIVLALGQKKTILKQSKDLEDLKNYSTIVRTKDLDSSLMVVSDSSEAVTLLLSNQIVAFLNKNASSVEYIHLSDLYTGAARDSDDTESVPDKVPQKWLQFSYRVTSAQDPQSFVQFALVLLDHVKSIRLSREGKEKVQKGRLKVTQSLEKLQHSQRQEAAQQRKEDKKKAEKEKMLNEPDPEKTRKWEEKEHKKALKKMGPKMKQMKIKG
ncbi:hypothetical protein EMCRGX_G012683 [Ephydatia muelleri]